MPGSAGVSRLFAGSDLGPSPPNFAKTGMTARSSPCLARLFVGDVSPHRQETRTGTDLGKQAGRVGTAEILLVILFLALSDILNLGFTQVCRSVCEDLGVQGCVLRGGRNVERVGSVDLLRMRHGEWGVRMGQCQVREGGRGRDEGREWESRGFDVVATIGG